MSFSFSFLFFSWSRFRVSRKAVRCISLASNSRQCQDDAGIKFMESFPVRAFRWTFKSLLAELLKAFLTEWSRGFYRFQELALKNSIRGHKGAFIYYGDYLDTWKGLRGGESEIDLHKWFLGNICKGGRGSILSSKWTVIEFPFFFKLLKNFCKLPKCQNFQDFLWKQFRKKIWGSFQILRT